MWETSRRTDRQDEMEREEEESKERKKERKKEVLVGEREAEGEREGFQARGKARGKARRREINILQVINDDLSATRLSTHLQNPLRLLLVRRDGFQPHSPVTHHRIER